MTHLPQMPAAAAAFSQPEFSLGYRASHRYSWFAAHVSLRRNAAQVLHVRTLEFLGKRFPSGVVGVWEHADVEGEVCGSSATERSELMYRAGVRVQDRSQSYYASARTGTRRRPPKLTVSSARSSIS